MKYPKARKVGVDVKNGKSEASEYQPAYGR